MRVLMVSPHPVYSPRGTPISVFNRCVALCALGHEVDLVTYPVGDDRAVDGLRYLRAPMPGVRSVAVGPSFRKFLLDGAVAVRSVRQGARRAGGRYDVVHTHEEAGLIGPAIARLAGAPHVYDMGNDWSDVLLNYGVGPSNPAVRVAARMEDAVIRRSAAVICHFPTLEDRVRAVSTTPVETVVNISLEADPDPSLVATIRDAWKAQGSSVLLYAGTLEPYQGVDLLVTSMVEVARTHPRALLVVVGGRGQQVDELQRLAVDAGVAEQVRFVGTVPPGLVQACLEAADVLVSPRRRGRNTPLKLFSYLRSGRPIVATDIPSHTQILGRGSSLLVAPTSTGLAAGIGALLDDGPVRERAVKGAAALRERYGVEQYVASVARAYAAVGGEQPDDVLVTRASERVRETTSAAAGLDAHAERLVGELRRPPVRLAV